MNFYHIHKDLFNPGDLIENGSMGSILETYTNFPNVKNIQSIWRLYQEQTFELIRVSSFPEKPSRLRSIFLFSSLEECDTFIVKENRYNDRIYQVEIQNKEKSIHIGSMKLYERIPVGRPVMPALIDQAIQYWEGINNIDSKFEPEILVESPVSILKIIK